jgi:hypothetical protein
MLNNSIIVAGAGNKTIRASVNKLNRDGQFDEMTIRKRK